MSNNRICANPWQQLNIDFFGNVRPCCFNKFQLGEFGNIKNTPILDIWNNDQFKNLRKALVTGNLAGSGCEDCRLLPIGGYPEYIKANVPIDMVDSSWANDCRLNEREYKEGKIELSSKPKVLQYYPSTICNLNCDFCYQFSVKGKTLGSVGKEMVSTLTPFLQVMNWIGGEPTILQEVHDWVKENGRKNKQISLVMGTNLARVTDEFFADLSNFNTVTFSISLDAVEKKLYEKLRKNGKWEITRANLYKALEIREYHDSFNVGVSCLLQKRNLHHLPDFLTFCQSNKIDAMVMPLDLAPLSMRLDLFSNYRTDLPNNLNGLMDESIKEAMKLDQIKGGKNDSTKNYVNNCFSIMKKGIEKAMKNTQVVEAQFPAGSIGFIAVARDKNANLLGYSFIDSKGKCQLLVPPDEYVEITVYQDFHCQVEAWKTVGKYGNKPMLSPC